MPQRPAMEHRPPPIDAPPILGRPATVSACIALWQLSFVAGLLAMANQLARRDDLLDRLLPQIVAARPQDTTLMSERNGLAILSLFSTATAGLILAEAGLALLLWRGRPRARWGLLIAGAASLLVSGLDYFVVAADGPYLRDLDRILIECQLVLIIGALVSMFLPSATYWFDTADKGAERRGPAAG